MLSKQKPGDKSMGGPCISDATLSILSFRNVPRWEMRSIAERVAASFSVRENEMLWREIEVAVFRDPNELSFWSSCRVLKQLRQHSSTEDLLEKIGLQCSKKMEGKFSVGLKIKERIVYIFFTLYFH